MNFHELIGETVIAAVPVIHRTNFQKLKIHGAEAGGIWVECQTLTDIVLKAIGIQAAERTPIFFLPFGQISFAWLAIPQTALSEKSLGV
jgi:hypothetical protein